MKIIRRMLERRFMQVMTVYLVAGYSCRAMVQNKGPLPLPVGGSELQRLSINSCLLQVNINK